MANAARNGSAVAPTSARGEPYAGQAAASARALRGDCGPPLASAGALAIGSVLSATGAAPGAYEKDSSLFVRTDRYHRPSNTPNVPAESGAIADALGRARLSARQILLGLQASAARSSEAMASCIAVAKSGSPQRNTLHAVQSETDNAGTVRARWDGPSPPTESRPYPCMTARAWSNAAWRCRSAMTALPCCGPNWSIW